MGLDINDYLDISEKEIDTKLNNFSPEYPGQYDSELVEYTEGESDEEKIGYKAIAMGETLDIILDTPEELINMLKLIDKILTIYKKEGYSDEFYTKLWKAGVDKKDLAVDNNPTEFLDTTFLSQEGLGKVLNEEENDLLNRHMEDLVKFLNKIIKNI